MNKKLLKKVSHILQKNKNYSALKTGFFDLDEYLSDVENGSLITIGSRPAMGKNSFAYSIILNLLEQNKKCLLFSINRSDILVIKYLLAQNAEIPLDNLLKKDLQNSDFKKITKAINNFKKYNLTIDDRTSMTVEKIEDKIKKCKPQYVFISDFQYLKLSKGIINIKSGANISSELKRIAKENDCIIFVLSQISRATDTRKYKRPLLCDLKDNKLEDVSDVVILIYRYDYYLDYEEKIGKTDIIIAKNKYASVHTIDLLFDSQFAKFVNPPQKDIFDF